MDYNIIFGNNKLTFYWTLLQDREFKKVVFQTVLPGEPFNSIYDAQDWDDEHTSEIIDKYAFELVFDPPSFVLPGRITPKQKVALKEYCLMQKMPYSAMPEILK